MTDYLDLAVGDWVKADDWTTACLILGIDGIWLWIKDPESYRHTVAANRCRGLRKVEGPFG